ncbi:unnamed protein product [Symbiodinium microadriaticum]|nr:unnamed protein product [Symbiodinium microadriaticum]CAE7800404.1 unnamed protein product [Symbiodinium sp. KB8]
MSLMPLGVLFNRSASKQLEPQLAISELFLLQYGISMKPGDQGQPGPSTKAAYGEIAAAVHVADKAIIPNVINAVLHRFGEMCAQHALVQVDFAPLGELKCEHQRLEFVSSSVQAKEMAPSTEPGKTVKSLMQRRGRKPDPLPSEGPPMVPGIAVTIRAEEDSLNIPSDALKSGWTGRSAPGQAPSPRRPQGLSPAAHGTQSLESKSNLELFVKSHPAKAIDFPPLLDEFSRTLAAPYGEDLQHGSSSGRIASHLSPLAGMLVWSHEAKCLKWRVKKLPKKDSKGQNPEFAPSDVLERTFENSQILPGSPLDLELKEAVLSRRVFYGTLLRYNYYIEDGIADSAVAPINPEWVENVGFLVEAERLFKDLPVEAVRVRVVMEGGTEGLLHCSVTGS